MKNIIYPAVFHKAEEGGYWVEFPDLKGCVTEGDTLEEAFNMAGDVLYAFLDGNEQLPEPSDIAIINTEGESFATLIKAEPYESEKAAKFKAIEAIEDGLTACNLNKNQAAQILGVDRSYFTYLSSGKKTPSIDMAKRIGLLLGFDWHVFFPDDTIASR